MTVGIATVNVANKFLDLLCRAQAWTAPAGFFVKLHTADPGSAGATAAAGNTTRVGVTFSAASGGSITNSASVDWTSVSTAETYSHISFWDASSAGNFLGSAALTASKTVAVGDNFSLPASNLTISISPVAA